MMKRFFTLLAVVMVAFVGIHAQQAELKKAAVNRYKNVSTLTAHVTMTQHNAALAKDAVTKGEFYYKAPNSESMVFAGTKDMLLAVGNTYTMVRNGKQRAVKANATGNNPFEVLRDIFTNLFTASGNANLTKMATVQMQKKGNVCTMTVTPNVTDSKAKRRMMYTSCVVTIDMKNAEIKTLRINERGSNYTQYDFSGYALNGTVSDNVFSTKIVKK